MSGPRLTKADWAARRAARQEGIQKRWREVDEPRLRREVRAELERRGLASFMNETRWRELCEAVYAELPFPPAFQLQPVVGERQPLADPDSLAGGWGGWSELYPSWSIEWLRVVPRCREHRGRLVPDGMVDVAVAFRGLLQRLRIPYREDEANTFWIYGYAAADPPTLTPPSETPT